MSSSLAVLILGAGPNLGAHIAKSFASAGYKVAVASRSGATSAEGYLSLKADFTKPDSIPSLFDAVKKEYNTAPSIVIYNAAASLTNPPDGALSLPVETFVSDGNVNTVSPYVAAQQAVLGWESLPKETKKTFIYTGNHLNQAVIPVPMMMTLGVGKAASAYWIGLADATYADKGYR
jgi:NAD(P)-dependent dehydrogenase (short-subunit alcohol dehydrogenase family)